jgi:hypothetical protein
MSDTSDQIGESPRDGASPAAKEFQEGQAAVASADRVAATGLDAASTPLAEAPPRITQRLAERKLVSGKLQITMDGKLVDLSEGGVCAMLDDPITIKKVCHITCNIFQNGKSYKFSLPSVVAYCVPVSGRGYKVGFQFGPRSAAVAQTIADVLKAS